MWTLIAVSRVVGAPVLVGLAVAGGCAGRATERGDPYPGVNTVAQDRAVWQQLLSDHVKIRRSVVYTPTGVEATTESDDPAVSARIIDHAKAMRARVEAGAVVRIWDPVFEELFARHGSVKLEVSPTAKGVTIIESSEDPEATALLWSHAAGVSDFVREGHGAGSRATVRLKPGTPPPGEVAIGGVKHRPLLTQPDAGALAQHAERGAKGVIDFRRAGEHADYDELAAAGACGLVYDNIAYSGAAELTDEILDRARAELRDFDARGEGAVLHCRSGNRVGPAWAVYRVLDRGVGVEQAMAEARRGGMKDSALEARARQYIERRAGR